MTKFIKSQTEFKVEAYQAEVREREAKLIEEKKDTFRKFEKAADEGDPVAQVEVGWCYQFGEGVTANIKQALVYYERSAKQGNATAWARLGLCYVQDDGGDSVKISEGLALIRRSVEQRNPVGLNNLAICYYQGVIPGGTTRIVPLLTESMGLGNTSARRNLARCYKEGTGVTQDLKKAKQLLEPLSEKGDEEATTEIFRINNLIASAIREQISAFRPPKRKQPDKDKDLKENVEKCTVGYLDIKELSKELTFEQYFQDVEKRIEELAKLATRYVGEFKNNFDFIEGDGFAKMIEIDPSYNDSADSSLIGEKRTHFDAFQDFINSFSNVVFSIMMLRKKFNQDEENLKQLDGLLVKLMKDFQEQTEATIFYQGGEILSHYVMESKTRLTVRFSTVYRGDLIKWFESSELSSSFRTLRSYLSFSMSKLYQTYGQKLEQTPTIEGLSKSLSELFSSGDSQKPKVGNQSSTSPPVSPST